MKYLLNYLKKLKKKKNKIKERSKKSLDIIRKRLKELEDLGGDIRALSKEAINDSINEVFIKAKASLKEAEKNIKRFNKDLFKVRSILSRLLTDSQLKIKDLQNIYVQIEAFEKDFLSAREEFFEAKILYSYIKTSKKKVLEPEQLALADFETYAGSLSDFCGELLRKAKLDVIKKKPNYKKEIEKYYKDTKSIYQTLANFSFSNKSGIRSKVDKLKGYICGFEDLLYDLDKKNK